MPDGGASIYAGIAAWYAAASWVTVAAYAIVAASVAYSAYTLATMPDMPGYSAETRGRTQIVRSAVTPHRIIYGQIMVSGPLVAAFSTGDNNKFIYLVIVLAAHEVEEIGDVYFGDKLATDPQFLIPDPIEESGHWEQWIVDVPADPEAVPPTAEVGHWESTGQVGSTRYVVDVAADPNHTRSSYSVAKYRGTLTQTADTNLMAYALGYNAEGVLAPCWTSAHKLTGRAYIVVKLEYNTDCFPQGIPNIKAVVKGNNQIYDPRTGTIGYTDNWALCNLDYLTANYGIRANCPDRDAAFAAAGRTPT